MNGFLLNYDNLPDIYVEFMTNMNYDFKILTYNNYQYLSFRINNKCFLCRYINGRKKVLNSKMTNFLSLFLINTKKLYKIFYY